MTVDAYQNRSALAAYRDQTRKIRARLQTMISMMASATPPSSTAWLPSLLVKSLEIRSIITQVVLPARREPKIACEVCARQVEDIETRHCGGFLASVAPWKRAKTSGPE